MTVPDDIRHGLRTPQFRLRTLLLAITTLCALLAVGKFLPAPAILALVMFLLTIIAHVAGSALGTQLRDSGSRPLPQDDRDAVLESTRARKLDDHHFAPATGLSQHRKLGVWPFYSVAAGAMIGGVVGLGWLQHSLGARSTLAKLSLGTFACCVLGGLLAFLVFTFVKVAVIANIEAWRHPEQK